MIRVSKKAKDEKKTINVLKEVINDLITEKKQLIRSYDEQLVVKRVSEEGVKYITDNMLLLLGNTLDNSQNPEEDKKKFEMLKPILSKDTFNVLQLLGFNFKWLFAEPLTDLINGLIASSTPSSHEKRWELETLIMERDIEYYKVLQDEGAYRRHKKFLGKNS